MRMHHSAGPGEPRLRIVFGDTAFALGLPVRPTYGDIADWVEDVASLHHSSPLSIDVRFDAPAQPRIAAPSASMGAFDSLDESHAVATSGQDTFAPEA